MDSQKPIYAYSVAEIMQKSQFEELDIDRLVHRDTVVNGPIDKFFECRICQEIVK